MPDLASGYAGVCTGATFVDAPAYSGPAPHFIVVAQPGGDTDAKIYLLDGWTSADPTKVQLVACVSITTGAQLDTCWYVGRDGPPIAQRLVRTTWDITIRQSRTGEVVGHSSVRGGDTQCDDFIGSFGDVDELQYTELTDGQLRAAIGRFVL